MLSLRLPSICLYDNLRRYPTVFVKMTGLRLNEFASLLDDMLPRFAQAEQSRLQRPNRRRAKRGGRHADLAPRDQILMAVIWLRQYPTNEVLGFLFGVSDSTVSRVVNRLVPLLEASGKDTMRLPDPGRKHRKVLDALLKETPELAVITDTFEQRVQGCKNRKDADAHFSGKKKQHTLSPYGLCAFFSAEMQPLFLRKPAFRLPVQAAYCWREQSSNPGEDTCDTRKANDHVRSEVLEKESAHQCSQRRRRYHQRMPRAEDLAAYLGRDEPLQQGGFHRRIGRPGCPSHTEEQHRERELSDEKQGAQQRSPEHRDHR